MEKFIGIICVSLLVFNFGCGTIDYKTYEPPPYEFEEFEEFESSIDQLTPIEPPNFIYVKINEENNTIKYIDEDSNEEATHIVLSSDELSKIEALVNRTITYKELAKTEGILINDQIGMINRHLANLKMERELTRQYYFMWKDARETYIKERREHTIDNLINRGTLVFGIIGGIAVAAL